MENQTPQGQVPAQPQAAQQAQPAQQPASPVSEAPKEPAQDNILAALAYIPMVFLVTALLKGRDAFHMWHAKMGAITTAIFIIPVIITAFIRPAIFGLFLYAVYFGFISIAGYKAWIGEKLMVPVLSQLAPKIPLEMLVKDINQTAKQIKESQEGKKMDEAAMASTPEATPAPAVTPETPQPEAPAAQKPAAPVEQQPPINNQPPKK